MAFGIGAVGGEGVEAGAIEAGGGAARLIGVEVGKPGGRRPGEGERCAFGVEAVAGIELKGLIAGEIPGVGLGAECHDGRRAASLVDGEGGLAEGVAPLIDAEDIQDIDAVAEHDSGSGPGIDGCPGHDGIRLMLDLDVEDGIRRQAGECDGVFRGVDGLAAVGGDFEGAGVIDAHLIPGIGVRAENQPW